MSIGLHLITARWVLNLYHNHPQVDELTTGEWGPIAKLSPAMSQLDFTGSTQLNRNEIYTLCWIQLIFVRSTYQ